MMKTVYDFEQTGTTVVVNFQQQELSHLDMQEAMTDLSEKLRYDNAQNFILNMEPVVFLPSASLGAMVEFLREVEHVRGRVLLAACGENVSFLFKVTRLDSVFPLFDDVAEAMEDL